jgi:hypothetical protein
MLSPDFLICGEKRTAHLQKKPEPEDIPVPAPTSGQPILLGDFEQLNLKNQG